jgi:hypothetical protein
MANMEVESAAGEGSKSNPKGQAWDLLSTWRKGKGKGEESNDESNADYLKETYYVKGKAKGKSDVDLGRSHVTWKGPPRFLAKGSKKGESRETEAKAVPGSDAPEVCVQQPLLQLWQMGGYVVDHYDEKWDWENGWFSPDHDGTWYPRSEWNKWRAETFSYGEWVTEIAIQKHEFARLWIRVNEQGKEFAEVAKELTAENAMVKAENRKLRSEMDHVQNGLISVRTAWGGVGQHTTMPP